MNKRTLTIIISAVLLSAGVISFYLLKPAVQKKTTDSVKSEDSSLYTRQDTQLNTTPSAPVSVSASAVSGNEISAEYRADYDGEAPIMPRTVPAVTVDKAISVPANQTLQTINQIQEINQRNKK